MIPEATKLKEYFTLAEFVNLDPLLPQTATPVRSQLVQHHLFLQVQHSLAAQLLHSAGLESISTSSQIQS